MTTKFIFYYLEISEIFLKFLLPIMHGVILLHIHIDTVF